MTEKMQAPERHWMELAIELAKRGRPYASPNPCVGAVLVKNGKKIGWGYHRKYGDLHAEREALKSCEESPEGADLYVTLEPCCHTGKQPPCTEAILQAGIRRVICGSDDPNPKVSGKGFQILKDHGLALIPHFMKEECDRINPVFFHYMKSGRPYLAYKYAMSLDGKIATCRGESQWISSPEAREFTHRLRHLYRGIMVGIGTVLHDHPRLTTRIEGLRDPIPIILDSRLRISTEEPLVKHAKDRGTIIATCQDDSEKCRSLEECGVTLLRFSGTEVPLKELLEELAARKIDSILLEGGPTLAASFQEEALLQKVYAVIAPKFIGGKSAPGPLGGRGIATLDHATPFKITRVRQLGPDCVLEAEQCSPD